MVFLTRFPLECLLVARNRFAGSSMRDEGCARVANDFDAGTTGGPENATCARVSVMSRVEPGFMSPPTQGAPTVEIMFATSPVV